MSDAAVALSKSDTYSFLMGNKRAEEVSSPLEAVPQNQSFANYHTGAMTVDVSPALVEQCAELRQMSVSTEFKKLAIFVQTLQSSLPTQNGLLVVILNPTWLAAHVPYCETPQDITEDMLMKSKWEIEFRDEYALIDGVPVWDRLDGERMDFYNIFKYYRDSRYLALDTGDYCIQPRAMAAMARNLSLSPLLINTLAKIYNWSIRCAYYDKFFEIMVAKRRQAEVTMLQRDHYKVANTLLERALDCLKNTKALTPKDAIAMAELGLKYSRVSLGLNGDKPGNPNEVNASPTLAIFNNTTNNNTDKMLNVNYSSEVERQLQENMKDDDNLLSILHVLQKSGAMATALNASPSLNGSIIAEEVIGVDNVQATENISATAINSSDVIEGGRV